LANPDRTKLFDDVFPEIVTSLLTLTGPKNVAFALTVSGLALMMVAVTDCNSKVFAAMLKRFADEDTTTFALNVVLELATIAVELTFKLPMMLKLVLLAVPSVNAPKTVSPATSVVLFSSSMISFVRLNHVRNVSVMRRLAIDM